MAAEQTYKTEQKENSRANETENRCEVEWED